ncbi:MAG: tyrosine-type recombinase/integrase [Parasphingorhabdus sp.]
MSALALPFKNWPETDRAMWRSLFQKGGVLDDNGSLSHLRLTTQKTLQERYGRWIGWLTRASPEVLFEPPAQRFTQERLSNWLKSLSHTSTTSQHMFVHATLQVLKSAEPARDWRKHTCTLKWLNAHAKGDQGRRKQGRVLSSAVLFKAGLQLAASEADATNTILKSAKYRRDGTMIALLALMPMRCRSFVELTLGTSFEVTAQDIVVRLSGDMTKNGLPWESPVPKSLHLVLRRYLEEVRPWLLSRGGQTTDVLWVDNKGAPYSESYFAQRIRGITERATGIRISPHLFRDSAATTLSRKSPKDAGLIRPLLAHASFGTAELHYIQAATIEVGRDYADILDKELPTRCGSA